MITKLNKKQKDQMAVYRDKWLKIGLSTEPFTFDEAKELVDFYYEKIANKKTVPIVIMDSPYTAWLAVCQCAGMDSGQVRSEVESQVGSQVWSEVESQVGSEVESQVGSEVESQVGSQVRSQVWSEVESQVRSQVWSQVRSQVWSQVGSEVESQVGSQVGSQVRSQVWSQVESFIYPYLDGHLISNYYAFYDYMNEVLGIEFENQEKWDWYKNLFKLELIYPLDNICILCQKPVEINMKNGKLHAEGKPSIKYKDGFSVWSLNGVRVPQYLAETPASKLDIEFFKKEKNADIKAEFIRKYGIERMVSMGKLVDTWQNHENTKNFNWYKKSEYKLIDMSPIFTTYNYLPYLYMKNQTVPGIYHLECCYNPNGQQPKTILEGLKIRLNGIDPEETEITAIA